MASLITIRLGGDIVGQCDAKCYDAKHDLCTCVCEGKNHGAGREKATDQTIRLGRKWVVRAREAEPHLTYEFDDTVQQHTLF